MNCLAVVLKIFSGLTSLWLILSLWRISVSLTNLYLFGESLSLWRISMIYLEVNFVWKPLQWCCAPSFSKDKLFHSFRIHNRSASSRNHWTYVVTRRVFARSPLWCFHRKVRVTASRGWYKGSWRAAYGEWDKSGRRYRLLASHTHRDAKFLDFCLIPSHGAVHMHTSTKSPAIRVGRDESRGEDA